MSIQNKMYPMAFAITSSLLVFPAYAEEDSFFTNWLDNVSRTQESQPHWMTPLVTVTPRLEQEYRFDYNHLDKPKGARLDNYGGGKGFEFIPSENTEVIVGVPAYQEQDTQKASTTGSGWGDESLLLKYRILSANEEHGNYIVSTFLGASFPTGSDLFTNHHTIITPTIAAGKGWGDREAGVDVQTTLGMSVPTGGINELGKPLFGILPCRGIYGNSGRRLKLTIPTGMTVRTLARTSWSLLMELPSAVLRSKSVSRPLLAWDIKQCKELQK